jgi:ADP-heptose:LPS heptosyltransferase
VSVYPSGATALRGRYLVKNRAVNAFLRARDEWLRVTTPRRHRVDDIDPRRVVLAVGGQLGDAVIATSMLRPVAAAFPGAHIGVICPSASAVVFEGHPHVRWIHRRDHWLEGRPLLQPRLLGKRLRRLVGGEARLRRDIEAVGYDIAIDLYPFFPNHPRLFADAGIPVRVGYVSGGGGPLLTHPIPWRDSRQHTSQQHHALLRALRPDVGAEALAYDLPSIPREDRDRGARLLEGVGLREGRYIVLHPGSGNPLKTWPRERWVDLIHRLSSTDIADRPRVVLTGAGAAERRVIDELIAHTPAAVSLCDQTSWQTFRYVVANARAVVGSDSVAAHLAAASGVPCIAIMAAMSDPEHWRPLGGLAIALTADVSCAPCFQSAGCSTMACVRDVSVDRVGAAVQELLHAPGRRE